MTDEEFLDLARKRNLLYWNFIQDTFRKISEDIKRDLEEFESELPECISSEFPELSFRKRSQDVD